MIFAKTQGLALAAATLGISSLRAPAAASEPRKHCYKAVVTVQKQGPSGPFEGKENADICLYARPNGSLDRMTYEDYSKKATLTLEQLKNLSVPRAVVRDGRILWKPDAEIIQSLALKIVASGSESRGTPSSIRPSAKGIPGRMRDWVSSLLGRPLWYR